MKKFYPPISTEHQDILKTPRILAVEDDEDNLLVIGYVIEKIHAFFLAAKDSITGLSLTNAYLPDLIILDIVLPDFDGFYFMSQIKQNPLLADIPVIAVTGLVSCESQEKIKQAGCVDYLIKPYLLETLEERILYHLPRPKLCATEN